MQTINKEQWEECWNQYQHRWTWKHWPKINRIWGPARNNVWGKVLLVYFLSGVLVNWLSNWPWKTWKSTAYSSSSCNCNGDLEPISSAAMTSGQSKVTGFSGVLQLSMVAQDPPELHPDFWRTWIQAQLISWSYPFTHNWYTLLLLVLAVCNCKSSL